MTCPDDPGERPRPRAWFEGDWRQTRMPAWMSPRRVGVLAALYAVFLAGWWLGQPVRSDGRRDGAYGPGAPRHELRHGDGA
ncbi:hypothetical protein [Streptomyces sp. CoH17]|uniref:hypothetical protein n=1 Tax=Streptomyces sp. CoH17 TaxID=2992806 RepID=UPI002270E04F|nr:hypothetical protein [Streptomyces sp. CoH17]